MNNKWKVHAAKFSAYAVLMLLFYVLQTTPGFLSLFGIKPNFVIPAALAVAFYEDEFAGGLYGALAGILCDHGAVGSLFGFNAVILLAAGTAAGLLVIYMLRPTVVNFVLLLCGTMLAQGLLDYLLHFYIWGYADVEQILLRKIFPTVAYTAAVSPILYYMAGWLHGKFEGLIKR